MKTTLFPAGASMAWEEALRAVESVAKLCQSWNFEIKPCCNLLVFYIDCRHLDQLRLVKFWNLKKKKFTHCPRLKKYPFPVSYQRCEWIVFSPWSGKVSGKSLDSSWGKEVVAEGSEPSTYRSILGFGGSVAIECSQQHTFSQWYTILNHLPFWLEGLRGHLIICSHLTVEEMRPWSVKSIS